MKKEQLTSRGCFNLQLLMTNKVKYFMCLLSVYISFL